MTRDRSKFAVFILTHGRPEKVVTLDRLVRSGYTGDIFFLIDDEDVKAEEYRAKFGAERVIQFGKREEAERFDAADTRDDRRSIVFARNASQRIAKEMGYDYLLQLDDDYIAFLYRYLSGDVIRSTQVRSMDKVIDAMVEFLEQTNATTVAFSQGGDHMGGVYGPSIRKGLLRKAMNSFFIRTDKPVKFFGRLNEDVNAYVVNGGRGELYLTVMGLQLNQLQTQTNSGGMSDIYKASGTYLKSFYTVMMAPSCVTISTMGRTDRRFHHAVRWNNAVPKIVSGRHRKED